MKATYLLECRNGYGEIKVKFEARSFSAAMLMASEWLKRNFIYHGWLVKSDGIRTYVSW